MNFQNEEDQFQAAIDANLQDMTAKLVFADWLEDRGDPRAEGYRVLGRLGKYPSATGKFRGVDLAFWYWVHAYKPSNEIRSCWQAMFSSIRSGYPTTRRECDDRVALAWLQLTKEQKDSVLAEDIVAANS